MTLVGPPVRPASDERSAGLPPRRTSRGTWWVFAVLTVALTATVVIASWAATQHGVARDSPSCVVIKAGSPGEELHATAAPCSTDPSFTVAKRADPAGDCAPGQYDQFRPPFTDQVTGRLCLVPNLVVGHCYRFGVPTGLWELGSCAEQATIRVTKRVDTDDPQACPVDSPPPVPGMALPAAGPRALSYPSRTYCYVDAPRS